MRIDGPAPTSPALLQAALGRAMKFAVENKEDAARPPVATTAQINAAQTPATSVAMLVALSATQETPIERRRRVAAGTDRGVSLLERLRDELAAGTPSPERLHELAAWAEGFAAPEEPVLADLAREVELRVRVELAKLDMRA